MVPPPVLLLVGTGPDADWLRTRIEEAPAPVFWHDQYVLDRRVLHTRLAASDVFVQPSRHEGFAVAPMEAMAAALPVIATDASGVRHLFGDIGGMIVAPEPRELANAIADAFADPVASRALGERGYQRISSEFSPVVVGRALRAFLGGGDVPVG
jgi:glycosyltransferase involved in cell wall biosynthesis